MKYLESYVGFILQSISALIYAWPVTIILVLLVCLAVTQAIRKETLQPTHRYWLIFTPLLLALATMSLGVFMQHPIRLPNSTGLPEPPSFPITCIYILLFLYLPVGIFMWLFFKGIRWVAMSLFLLQVWYGLVCSFIAGMAVTGSYI